MADKIDRSEARPAYRISESKDIHEDRHQSREQKEEEEARYKKTLENKEWEKFHRREITVKPMKVKRERIQQCLFRNVVLRGGKPILMIDLVWTNGQSTEGALLLLQRTEDYFKLRTLMRGTAVPEEFWARGTDIEVGIPQQVGGSGPIAFGRTLSSEGEPATQASNKKATRLELVGLVTAEGKPEWRLIIGIIIALGVIALALWQSAS